MLRICLFLCLLAGNSMVFSQYVFRGIVKNKEGTAEGASLTLENTEKKFTTSGTDGSFAFYNLKQGNYTLTCTYQGYATLSKTFKAEELTGIQELQLTPLPASLQPVEVKALRAGALSPFSKTDLGRSFIEKNNLGQDIPMLLSQTPNVVSFSDAGNGVGYTGLRIRGTDATRINMTINGIPYNDPESQGTFFVNLPDFLSGVSSIQVQRGVGTSSNGAGAFGASMNFSTHETQPTNYLEFNNSYGSFNTLKNTLKLGKTFLNDKLSVDLRLSHIKSDGYVDRASSTLKGGYLSAAYFLPKSTFRFNAILGDEKTYQSWNGISLNDLKNNRTYNSVGTEKPGEPYDNETDNYKQNHYQLFYNTEMNSSLSFNTAFYLTTGKGYYEQYKANADPADYGLPGTEETDIIRQLWLDNKLFGQIFNLQYKKNKDEIIWGGGWNHYPGQHFGNVIWSSANTAMDTHRWYDHDAKKSDVNSYVKWQRQLGDRWSMFTDLQYRYVNYQIDGFRNSPDININETWNFINPKAGITYHDENWTAFASYALANKEPNRDDFEAGTTQKPTREQLHNVELGFQRKELLPGLQVAVNAYLMYYNDQLILTGKINDVGAYTRTNHPESYRLGTEMELRYARPKWGLQYSLALSQNRAIDYTGYYDDYDNGGQLVVNHGNTPLALSPGMVQQTTIDWRPANNLELSLLNKYVGKQYLDNSGDVARALDAFWVSDIRMSYDLPVKKWLKRVRILVQVNNLLNTLYEPNGFTFSYQYENKFITENFYYPMAGINFMAGLNIRL